MRHGPLGRTLLVLGGAAAYFGAAQVGFALDLVGGTVSTIWVPTGLSLALLLIGGRGLWPAILIGEFAANVAHGAGAGTSLAFGAGDVLEALAGYELLVRTGFRSDLRRLRDVLSLLLPAALLPTLIGATVGTAALVLGESLPWSGVWLTWHTWWLGDASGVIVVTPLVLVFSTGKWSWPSTLRALEMIVFAAALAPIAWVAAGNTPYIALASLPILIWGALRFGQRGAALANAVVAGAGIALMNRVEHLSDLALVNRLLLTQNALEISAITTLVLAAVISERERTADDLRDASLAALALADEQAQLSRVATAIASEAPLSEVFELVVSGAGSLLRASGAALIRYDGIGLTSQVASWTEDPEGRISVADTASSGIGALVTVRGIQWGRLWLDAAGPRQSDPPEAVLKRFATLLALAIASTEARQHLVDQASTDPLTGLANHRAFHERLVDEMARCRRYGHTLAIAMIDVDNFKEINDAFGHRAGDRVLATVARRISAVVRSEALVARVGGDELAMILPQCDAETAAAAVERARTAVSAEPILDDATVTLSAGVCDSGQGDMPDMLLEFADAALYTAKAAGRDACVTYAAR